MNISKSRSLCKSHGGSGDERILLQNYVISKLNRRDLEDRYYSIWSNNINLKKRLNLLNDKIKFLNTKLARQTNQQKKDFIISHKCCKNFENILKEKDHRIHQLQQLNYDLLEKNEILEERLKLNIFEGRNGNDFDLLDIENKNWEKDYFELSNFEELQNYQDYKKNDVSDTRLEPIRENNVEHVEEKLLFLEKEIENLKTENKNILKDVNSKETESKVKFQDTITQTDGIELYIKMEDSNENEHLRNKLDEQYLKVEELQRQLENNKLKHDILDIVKNNINDSNKNDDTDNMKKIEIYENRQKLLEKELFDAKLSKESLEIINKKLSIQIIDMQSKIDFLSIENKALQIEEKHQMLEENTLNKDKHKINNVSNNHNMKNENVTNVIEEASQYYEPPITDNMAENPLLNEVENPKPFESNNINSQNTDEKVDNDKKNTKKNDSNTSKNENEIQNIHENNTNIIKNSHEVKSAEQNKPDYDQLSEKSETDEDSKYVCDIPLNDVTYDISTNSSTERSHTPLESSSEGYLSDGEVRKDTIITLPHSKKKNSELLYSNIKQDNGVTKSISKEISIKQTIDEISKEMEKCEQLLNPRYRKELQTIQNFKSTYCESEDNLDITNKMVLFTLHITSIELSDKAVNMLQKNLYYLTWTLYNEVVAYTPMCQDQISVINFTTTYNINLTNEFLTYLCNESIQIDINEMINEKSEFFACTEICLMEILNNVNNSVEFKLKLLKNGDSNYGIIDCWCKLEI